MYGAASRMLKHRVNQAIGHHCHQAVLRHLPVPKHTNRRCATTHILRVAMSEDAAPSNDAATVKTADKVDAPETSFTAPSPVMTIDKSEYVPQLERKLVRLKELFSSLSTTDEPLPEVEVFTSEPSHYRMRAEFTVWGTSKKALKEGPPDVHFIMYDTASGVKPPPKIRIGHWPVGSVLMNELMEVVLKAANSVPCLREQLFQVNFHTGLSGESMVTLVYHKKLDDLWLEAAKELRKQLSSCPSTQGHVPHVIGRSHKQKIELDESHITERLVVNGKTYFNRQVEGSFSQPNSGVCQHMLSWAQNVTRPQPTGQDGQQAAALKHDHDLLELYCGNGNFTIPLAENFRRVVATEVSKTSVEAAKHNMEVNKVDNIFVARMSSEEFSEAWHTGAQKRRLEGLGDWSQLKLKTILVDPPRAGLDGGTLKLVSEFDQVVYISCNPETLHDNLKTLTKTHKIQRMAAFDQFPYTHHLETGVFLVKRS